MTPWEGSCERLLDSSEISDIKKFVVLSQATLRRVGVAQTKGDKNADYLARCFYTCTQYEVDRGEAENLRTMPSMSPWQWVSSDLKI